MKPEYICKVLNIYILSHFLGTSTVLLVLFRHLFVCYMSGILCVLLSFALIMLQRFGTNVVALCRGLSEN